MKELKNFRRFINEEVMKGDSVVLKGDDDKMEVLSVRDMFASDLKAYRVKNADGETFEYSEDQIEKVNEYDSAPPNNNVFFKGKTKAGDKIEKEGDKKEIKEEEGFVEVSVDEVMGHINQYQKGNIDGDDLAQAIEEIVVGRIVAPGVDKGPRADISISDMIKTYGR